MKGISRYLMVLLFLVALFAGLVFSSHNQTPILLWPGAGFGAKPVGLWIIAAFSSGGLVGLILAFGLWRNMPSRRSLKKLQQKLLLTETGLVTAKQQNSLSNIGLKKL